MRILTGLLLTAPHLVAQGVEGLGLHSDLGMDPAAQVRLAPPGCWDRLILSGPPRPLPSPRRGPAGATVEVWDLAYPDTPRRETFTLYLQGLKGRLTQAFATPPPSHGTIELGDIMQSDPSQPQKLDLTKVRSMQDRFNPPPRITPVR